MEIVDKPQRFGRHDNAFGFLRLLFASLVIVSHTPELIDGDYHREILGSLFGTTTFGGFAVSGFFVISGFLVTGSLVNSHSITSYVLKRIGRIYPGFIVASLVSLLVVAPLADAYMTRGVTHTIVVAGLRMAALARPMLQGAFPGLYHSDVAASLNGPMWTIQYEFACYLLIIALVAAGLLRRPVLMGVFAAIMLLTPPDAINAALPGLSHPMLFPGRPQELFRLPGMFAAGATFYAFQHRLRFEPWMIAASIAGLLLSMCAQWSVNPGFALFGGYLIFATAALAGGTRIGTINSTDDISYGVYLYAWPVEKLLLRYSGTENLIVIGLATWLIAAALGWLSWHYVEKPALGITRKLIASEPRGATRAGTLAGSAGIAD